MRGKAALVLVVGLLLLSKARARYSVTEINIHNDPRRIDKKALHRGVEDRFNQIYAGRGWGTAGRGSGPGSSLQATTVTRAILRTVIAKMRLHSMLDAPCGAVEWQPIALQQILEDDPTFTYKGVDVVRSVIVDNRERHGSVPYMSFDESNLANEAVAPGYDLILSRDALQHVSCEVGVDMLENFAQGQAKYLLLGSYDGSRNMNIETGGYFDINLREFPYNLKEGVLHVYHEFTNDNSPGINEPEKLLLLYTGKYLADADFDTMRANCQKLNNTISLMP